ncbi:lipid-binding SYLF domain-containing protein [Candidatus Laterigemmans baculatus]|uniref:lipid-binding SYLF domain-containing protein n=1 Tax=Candidatus Laterigemmans baculatus TaxID=2770505 RepID=UPI0013DC80B9|nr:lipid-binding SYLF domain-containing protein [Candidatus Laterigemmans baculatus]
MGTVLGRNSLAALALGWTTLGRTTLGRALCCGVVLLAATPAHAQLFGPLASEPQTVTQATMVLRELNTVRVAQIPHNLLTSAEAVAIVPGMMRGAFVVGLQRGRGVVLVKDETGAWQPPQFVTLTGGSVGWQAGIQATDLVLIFSSRGSVHSLLQGKITVGVDASAAAGPVGRRVSAATDLPLEAEIYSYSRSRGLFAGVSLDGSSLQMDPVATNNYYATAPPPTLPATALELLDQLRPFAVPAPSAGGPPRLEPAGPPLDGSAALGTPLGTPAPAHRSLAHRSLAGGGQPMAPNQPALPGTAAAGASLPRVQQAPAATAATAAPVETAATLLPQLAEAAAELDPLLDAQWKGYLQIPSSVLQADRAETSGARLEQVIARYDAVAANPRYASLGQRAEFHRVRQLLHRLAAAQRQPAPLNLPPPPGP